MKRKRCPGNKKAPKRGAITNSRVKREGMRVSENSALAVLRGGRGVHVQLRGGSDRRRRRSFAEMWLWGHVRSYYAGARRERELCTKINAWRVNRKLPAVNTGLEKVLGPRETCYLQHVILLLVLVGTEQTRTSAIKTDIIMSY